jgi:hypothetical protein
MAHSGLFVRARRMSAFGGKADTSRNGSGDAYMSLRPSQNTPGLQRRWKSRTFMRIVNQLAAAQVVVLEHL